MTNYLGGLFFCISILLVACTSTPPTDSADETLSQTGPTTSATVSASLVVTVTTSPVVSVPTVTPAPTITLTPDLNLKSHDIAVSATIFASESPTITPPETLPPTITPTNTPQPNHDIGPIRFDPAEKLLVDSEGGRLYTVGYVADQRQILVLSTEDGQVIDAYPWAGALALDAKQGYLYIDRDAFSLPDDLDLKVLDVNTGQIINTIPLADTYNLAPPLANRVNGAILAFREKQVYIFEPTTGKVKQTFTPQAPQLIGCNGPDSTSPYIQQAIFNPDSSLLYLAYTTYLCIPNISYSYLVYQLNPIKKVAEEPGYTPARALLVKGNLYETTFSWSSKNPVGNGVRAMWRAGESPVSISGWGDSGLQFVYDPQRHNLYEATTTSFLVFDPETMNLNLELPRPASGRLAGYDPQTDQLYFVNEDRVQAISTNFIQPLTATQPVNANPPLSALRHIFVSPTWPQDQTIFGLWEDTRQGMVLSEIGCWVVGQQGYHLLMSQDGGQTWRQPHNGFGPGCPLISTVAFSPDYEQDDTLFIARVGRGILKSTDKGWSWHTQNTGLENIGIRQLFISPTFPTDQTLWAISLDAFYRSPNAARSWQKIVTNYNQVALSPEFHQDKIMLQVANQSGDGQELQQSTDGGQTWTTNFTLPSDLTWPYLSLAPNFERWGVAFAYGSDGILYRTSDSGQTWSNVLTTEGNVQATTQLVYAPDIEVNRPLFFLTTTMVESNGEPTYQSNLYRSPDGGLSWTSVTLPDQHLPTAITISPNFARDNLLFIGTATGNLLMIRADNLESPNAVN